MATFTGLVRALEDRGYVQDDEHPLGKRNFLVIGSIWFEELEGLDISIEFNSNLCGDQELYLEVREVIGPSASYNHIKEDIHAFSSETISASAGFEIEEVIRELEGAEKVLTEQYNQIAEAIERYSKRLMTQMVVTPTAWSEGNE